MPSLGSPLAFALGGDDIPNVKGFLLSLLPPGFTRWFDFSPGSFGDQILDGAAEQFALRVVVPTDEADANNNPWTLASSGLGDWEKALGIEAMGTTSDAARQLAIISKLRQHGASTIPNIQAILGPLLGYVDPTQLEILETDRAALAALNTYSNFGGAVIPGGGSVTQTVFAADNSVPIGPAGVVLVVVITTATPSDITLTLTGPNGAFGQAIESAVLPVGTAAGARISFPSAAGKTCNGTWTLQASSAALGATLNSWGVFVEGIGRQPNGADGHGAGIFEWSARVDPTLEGAAAPANEAAARAAISRIKPAHTAGYLTKKMSGGSAVAVYDDANAIENACVYA